MKTLLLTAILLTSVGCSSQIVRETRPAPTWDELRAAEAVQFKKDRAQKISEAQEMQRTLKGHEQGVVLNAWRSSAGTFQWDFSDAGKVYHVDYLERFGQFLVVERLDGKYVKVSK